MVVRYDFSATDAELESLAADFGNMYKVPDNFEATVTPYNPQLPQRQAPAPQININPQTTLICDMLGVTDPFAIFSGRQPFNGALGDIGAFGGAANNDNTNDSLDVDDRDEGILDDSDFINSTIDSSSSFVTANSTFNPDEISLDDLDNDDGAAPATDACEPPTKRQSFSPAASHSASETELPTDNSEDIISDSTKQESPDPKPAVSSTPVAQHPRSLKRRNFAIYSAADNSSNESD